MRRGHARGGFLIRNSCGGSTYPDPGSPSSPPPRLHLLPLSRALASKITGLLFLLQLNLPPRFALSLLPTPLAAKREAAPRHRRTPTTICLPLRRDFLAIFLFARAFRAKEYREELGILCCATARTLTLAAYERCAYELCRLMNVTYFFFYASIYIFLKDLQSLVL